MDIQLLLSELNEVPSLSDPVEDLYNRNNNIPNIVSIEDIDVLLDLRTKLFAQLGVMNTPYVEINVMQIHVSVIKPYISQSDDEDDFI